MKIKWNVGDTYPLLTHYIVAPNMKMCRMPGITSAAAARDITRRLMR